MFMYLCLSQSRQFTSIWLVTLPQMLLLPVYDASHLVAAFFHPFGVTMEPILLELPEKLKTYMSFT